MAVDPGGSQAGCGPTLAWILQPSLARGSLPGHSLSRGPLGAPLAL